MLNQVREVQSERICLTPGAAENQPDLSMMLSAEHISKRWKHKPEVNWNRKSAAFSLSLRAQLHLFFYIIESLLLF